MRLNLHLTHWSLLFITLMSSCFLFYVVASENAKYATTKPTIDAIKASNVAHSPSPITSAKTDATATATTTPTADLNEDTIVTSTDDYKNIENNDALDKDNTNKILPNYKKVKKLIPQPQPQPSAPSDEAAIISDNLANLLEDGASFVAVNSDDSKINNEIKSSDSVLVDNDNDNNKIVINKNVYNSADDELQYTTNEIHSSEEPTSQQIVNEQVPDVKQQQQHTGNIHDNVVVVTAVADDNADKDNSLPDISDIPTVTVTELPLEILQPPQPSVDAVIFDDGSDRRSQEERVNRTVDIIAESEEEIQKDEQIVKINDSGGKIVGLDSTITTTTTTATPITEDAEVASTTNIPADSSNINDTQPSIGESLEQRTNDSSSNTASQVNLTAATAEEVPMPVFSEWAQKQMEAAEKQQALEQEQTFNNSAQRKNNTNGNGKPPALKIRAKNYASPDCGAKIIASSAYTSNAGAVLSSSKDEYMLSLCGNRIWFVVELCEAIQAQKIDFANFELYSSSPQNFTVAVAKRFPTRDWSNVGRFEADDKRTVQSFDLHPQLFGKFVRVDINSHYSKEHFCTLSLFRVFGTSEFEAFDTENHPNDDLDDFDDDYLLDQNNVKNSESNLFKSASDAVLSIVKKATEVLGKPANNQNQTFKTTPQSVVCRTPIYGLFSCPDCSSSLVERVNNALTCEFTQLNSLLNIEDIRNDLLDTKVCFKRYGIETNPILNREKDIRRSFYVNILPNEYVGALCQLLAMPKTTPDKLHNNSLLEEATKDYETDLPSNLTVEKKFDQEDLKLLDHPENKLIKPEMPSINVEQASSEPVLQNPAKIVETSTEIHLDDNQQLPRPLEPDDALETTTLAPPQIIEKPILPDTNIFNVPADEPSSETEIPAALTTEPMPNSAENSADTATPAPPTTYVPTASPIITETVTASPQLPPKSEEDSNSWDNIEHLLTSTVASTVGGGSGSAQYNQQKISNGPQSESVFIRLSNRIKALERNMSLSGQYLEELSRRYKKQVEELQQTLTQQIQTVRTLEEQSRRHNDLEQLYALRNSQLKDELDDLTLQVHACIVVIIFVGAFVFLVLMVGILFYRSMRRETKEVLSLYDKGDKKKTEAAVVVAAEKTQKKINRRKSFEDFSDRQQGVNRLEQDTKNASNVYGEKARRPSEEAMLILKDCKGEGRAVNRQQSKTENEVGEIQGNNSTTTTRQRKMSVCYGSNNNVNAAEGLPPIQPQKSSQGKRRGEKHSWPNTEHAQQQAWQHLEQLHNDDLIGDSADVTSMKNNKKPPIFNGNGKTKKKKETQSFKRQQSSPAECSTLLNSSAPAALTSSDFDERLMLDEDDLDNFIPNTDLAYNEFMPDGPRGYQCVNSNAANPASKKATASKLDNLKKARRLSSPVFFKSPFTKSLKGKTSSKSNPAHESTSWEWYRLKKSASSTSSSSAKQTTNHNSSTNNAFLRVSSPNASLDSSSLSEINFPTNSTANSFRILEEAILSSGESAITTTSASSSNVDDLSKS